MKVKEADMDMWAERMETKKSLAVYKSGKPGIKKENFYDNSKGSALLYYDRAGCLRTRTYVSKYSPEDEARICCAEGLETIKHIVIEIHQARNGGKVPLPEALGFTAEGS